MSALFVFGDVVRLEGLVSGQFFNGAIRTVVADAARGRYVVNLLSPATAVAAQIADHARLGCDQIGTKNCSACSNAFYCSAECQRTD
jgi:predicted GNAT superfamily acetyltransferase